MNLNFFDNSSCIEFNGDFEHHHPAMIEEHIEEIEEFARVSPIPKLSLCLSDN